MSSFAAYNTDDAKAPAGTYPPLASNGVAIIGPIQTGIATKIVGSVFSDTAGTLLVQQTFEDPSANHWDVSQSFAVVANTPLTIDIDSIAPFLQLKFTNSASVQAHLRIFARAYGVNRG